MILLRARNKYNKVVLCLTDTSLCIYISVKQFGMANIKFEFCKEAANIVGYFSVTLPTPGILCTAVGTAVKGNI